MATSNTQTDKRRRSRCDEVPEPMVPSSELRLACVANKLGSHQGICAVPLRFTVLQFGEFDNAMEAIT
jgi:hypothetical protein